jgi:type VI secretion system protein ImpC
MSETQVPSAEGEAQLSQSGEFETLLAKEYESMKLGFAPRGDVKPAIKNAVQLLAEQALRRTKTPVISDDAIQMVNELIAEIDGKLSKQINLIIHHEKFQNLESAWRGLHYLVMNTETDENLKIRILDVSKNKLAKTFKEFPGKAWDQSPIFKLIYENGYGILGGRPYGCLVGDYYFDHSPTDVEMLKSIAQVSAAAFAPFISGVKPSLLQMHGWRELSNPRDLAKIFDPSEYDEWKSLRELEDARYIGLAMPRFLARRPYGKMTDPVEEFDFEEITDLEGSGEGKTETASGEIARSHDGVATSGADAGASGKKKADSDKYVWANSAYAMALNITTSFKLYGWCSRIRGIESGGLVEDLFKHTYPTADGGEDKICPTETAISDRREKELASIGLMPLVYRVHSDKAAFIGAQSLQKPQQFMDPGATANAELSARLPYIFATSRFAHYLKCIVRDKIGAFQEREDMRKFLDKWITHYIDGDPERSTEATKSEKPLREAHVVLEDIDGKPGEYHATFYLRPHYQLEGLTVSLRLVSTVPSVKRN